MVVLNSSRVCSLSWAEDGNLCPSDYLDLLAGIMAESVPEVQYELILLIESLSIGEVDGTPQLIH